MPVKLEKIIKVSFLNHNSDIRPVLNSINSRLIPIMQEWYKKTINWEDIIVHEIKSKIIGDAILFSLRWKIEEKKFLEIFEKNELRKTEDLFKKWVRYSKKIIEDEINDKLDPLISYKLVEL